MDERREGKGVHGEQCAPKVRAADGGDARSGGAKGFDGEGGDCGGDERGPCERGVPEGGDLLKREKYAADRRAEGRRDARRCTHGDKVAPVAVVVKAAGLPRQGRHTFLGRRSGSAADGASKTTEPTARHASPDPTRTRERRSGVKGGVSARRTSLERLGGDSCGARGRSAASATF